MKTKELREAASFACTVEFWRMAILWTFSLIMSYFQLFMGRFVFEKQNVTSVPSSSVAVTRPVCIITGATSGLGAAAAHALSREGFYVVFGL